MGWGAQTWAGRPPRYDYAGHEGELSFRQYAECPWAHTLYGLSILLKGSKTHKQNCEEDDINPGFWAWVVNEN